MYIVSGCPRSGTSLMMEIFRVGLGASRVIGKKFPEKVKITQHAGETDAEYAYRRYLSGGRNSRDTEDTKDMNPDGFWECPFTVKGVSYRPELRDLIARVGVEDPPLVCKVVSQGLWRSNPVYIDGVVYMLRRPEAVAKSQERLKRKLVVQHPVTNCPVDLFEGALIRSPSMFIEVTCLAADWLSTHRDVPLYIVKYEDLVAHPAETVAVLGEKLHENLNPGIACVRPELDRSSKIAVTHPLLQEAEQVYQWFLQRNWNKIIKYRRDRQTKFNKEQRQWYCARSRSVTQELTCRMCTTDVEFRNQLVVQAGKEGIDWKSQPCAYECAYSPDRETHTSIEESIKNNHWEEVS